MSIAPKRKPNAGRRVTIAPESLPFNDLSPLRMTQSDIGRLFGLSKGRISQMVTAGTITPIPNGGGRIDPNRAALDLLNKEGPRRASGRILNGFITALQCELEQRDAEKAHFREVLGGLLALAHPGTDLEAAIKTAMDALPPTE